MIMFPHSELPASDLRYPVFETFHSWQGEGAHMGKSAFFIRLYGCPIQCPWCDSAGTWRESANRGDRKIELKEARELAKIASQAKPEIVVVTGGEPAIHDLRPLTRALHEYNLPVHLETSGAFPIRGEIDWITLSPKVRRFPLSENIAQANEIKLIITVPRDLDFWEDKICGNSASSIWLHPEWGQRENKEVLSAISSWVRQRGAPFRAGWQIHKLYGVD